MTITVSPAPVQTIKLVESSKRMTFKDRVVKNFDNIGYRLLAKQKGIIFTPESGKGADLKFESWDDAKQWLIKAEAWKIAA